LFLVRQQRHTPAADSDQRGVLSAVARLPMNLVGWHG
jgi:hypothetical protein